MKLLAYKNFVPFLAHPVYTLHAHQSALWWSTLIARSTN